MSCQSYSGIVESTPPGTVRMLVTIFGCTLWIEVLRCFLLCVIYLCFLFACMYTLFSVSLLTSDVESASLSCIMCIFDKWVVSPPPISVSGIFPGRQIQKQIQRTIGNSFVPESNRFRTYNLTAFKVQKKLLRSFIHVHPTTWHMLHDDSLQTEGGVAREEQTPTVCGASCHHSVVFSSTLMIVRI